MIYTCIKAVTQKDQSLWTPAYLFFAVAFLILFNALVSFLIRASTILYLPLTPLGLPLTPRFAPVATTIFFSFIFSRPCARLITLPTARAFSAMFRSSASITPSAFRLAFSILCTSLNFFLAFASATFLIGRASRAR